MLTRVFKLYITKLTKMSCLMVYYILLFYMCLSTLIFRVHSDRFDEIQYDIRVSINTQNANDNLIKRVTFDNKQQFDIILTDETLVNKAQIKEEDKINIFYSVITCSSAEWTINEIYTFIRRLPLFYERTFVDTSDGKFSKVFIDNHEMFEENFSFINKKVNNFINIIQNFLDIYSNVLYYNDRAILKALVSLKIKMNLLTLVEDGQLKEFQSSDYTIIREFLEEMNAFQNAMAIHCEAPPHNQKDSQFYGISTMTDRNVEKMSILIDTLKLLKDPNDCSPTQILLEKFVNITDADYDLNEIAIAKLIINHENKISIQNIWEQIRPSYDVETMYHYNMSVINTIMKLIAYKILKELQQRSLLLHVIIKMIQDINLKIKNEKPTSLPENFINGFRLFAKIGDNAHFNQSMIYDISYFHNSIDRIELKILLVDLSSNEVNGLQNLLTNILYNFNDILCSYQYFKCLQNEDDKSYLPLIDSKVKMLSISFQEEPCDVCDFLQDMYYICYNTIVSLNRSMDDDVDKKRNDLKNEFEEVYQYDKDSNDKRKKGKEKLSKTNWLWNKKNFKYEIISKEETKTLKEEKNINEEEKIEKPSHITRAWNSIVKLRDYFLKTIEISKDPDLLKIAINIVIILVNQKEPTNIMDAYHLKRIINIIMTELNSYAVPYCSQPTFNFLLFNNVNFIQLKTDKKMKMFLKKISSNVGYKINLDFSLITNDDYKCFSTTFVSNLVLKDFNQESVKFVYWNGKKTPIENVIYSSLNSAFLNPNDLYAIYDLYFKMYISVVYSEIKKLYDFLKLKPNNPQNLSSTSETNNFIIILHNSFPLKLKPLIDNINDLWKKIQIPAEEYNDKNFNILIGQIEKQMINFYIFKENIPDVILNVPDNQREIIYNIARNNIIKKGRVVDDNVSFLFSNCYLKFTRPVPRI